MKRALAVVAVAVMLAGAMVLRSRGQDARQADQNERSRATLWCATEVAPACEALRAGNPNLTVVIDDAGRSLGKVTGAGFNRSATPIDAWLVPRSYVDLVTDNRSRAGLDAIFGDPSRVLARSPVVMVGSAERLKVLAARCGGQVSWRCAGDNAGRQWSELGGQQSWGELQPVLGDPNVTATAMSAVSAAAASYFSTPNVATNDLDDPTFRDWFGQLSRTSASVNLSGQVPLDRLLSVFPAPPNLVGALEAQAGPGVEASRDKDRLSILYPSPLATTDVVLAPISGSEPGERLKNELESGDSASALARTGWRVDGQPLASGLSSATPIPADSQLPKPGAQQALARAWGAAT